MEAKKRKRLFEYFSQEYNVSLLDSDFNEIEHNLALQFSEWVSVVDNYTLIGGQMEISQKYYQALEFDLQESDIIQIWQNGKEHSNVVQIERERINDLIEKLKQIQSL